MVQANIHGLIKTIISLKNSKVLFHHKKKKTINFPSIFYPSTWLSYNPTQCNVSSNYTFFCILFSLIIPLSSFLNSSLLTVKDFTSKKVKWLTYDYYFFYYQLILNQNSIKLRCTEAHNKLKRKHLIRNKKIWLRLRSLREPPLRSF